MNNCKTCNCPPDYTFQPAPQTPCNCCPPRYIYSPSTANYPNGYCSYGNIIIATMPCNSCAETLFTECVIYNGNDLKCLGIQAGMNLNTVLDIIEKKCELLMDVVNRPVPAQVNAQVEKPNQLI